MAYVFKKKTSSIFSPPSYLPSKKNKNIDKIEAIILETIQAKIFNLLNINKKVYLRLVEYFITYTCCTIDGSKSIASFNLRLRNKIDKEYKKIYTNEIELSGIAVTEFLNYLDDNGAVKINDIEKILIKI